LRIKRAGALKTVFSRTAEFQDAQLGVMVLISGVFLRVDSDVLEWFRKQGSGHPSRMNAVQRR